MFSAPLPLLQDREKEGEVVEQRLKVQVSDTTEA